MAKKNKEVSLIVLKKIYFLVGCHDLYGEDALKTIAADANAIVSFLNEKFATCVEIAPAMVLRNAGEITLACQKASAEPDCCGIIAWMHTFSPAKMWIRGLQSLSKPLLHLHTQIQEKIPYDTIDMDFMNLNQSAHGDREFGFLCTRMHIQRHVVVGYYKHPEVLAQIQQFAEIAKAIHFSRNVLVAQFGGTMREVADTDGDRVELQSHFGWNVNTYGIGDLVKVIDKVPEEQIDLKMAEYQAKYEIKTNDINAIREQAKYEIGLESFLKSGGFEAFTDTFQDLTGFKQLPALAVQNLMSRGIGFGAEGDYKTAALCAVLTQMAKDRIGATGFMEDYTYDLTQKEEIVLGAHMAEVSPVFAAEKPTIEVHKLSIGERRPPARLVFEGITGEAIAVSIIDLGNRFRLVAAEIELVKQPKPMPKLPVARLMWRLKPDFKTGAAAWIYAGGGHHTVVSTALTLDDLRLYAKLTNTELVTIDQKTTLDSLQKELETLDLLSKLR
jgi:L-arabinose isomerase